MRTEKLELDKDSGTNTLAAMFSNRFLGLSATRLFRNTPNTTRITRQVVKTQLRVKPLHGYWSRKNPKVIK